MGYLSDKSQKNMIDMFSMQKQQSMRFVKTRPFWLMFTAFGMIITQIILFFSNLYIILIGNI